MKSPRNINFFDNSINDFNSKFEPIEESSFDKQKGSYIESIPDYVEEVKNSTVNFSVTSTKIITKKPKLAVKVKNVKGNQ